MSGSNTHVLNRQLRRYLSLLQRLNCQKQFHLPYGRGRQIASAEYNEPEAQQTFHSHQACLPRYVPVRVQSVNAIRKFRKDARQVKSSEVVFYPATVHVVVVVVRMLQSARGTISSTNEYSLSSPSTQTQHHKRHRNNSSYCMLR